MVGRRIGMEPGDTVIRWWVSKPVNTDSYDVYVVSYPDDDPQFAFYWHDDKWNRVPLGGAMEPAISLPGLLCAQMMNVGRENTDRVAWLVQGLCEQVWEATKGKEPA